MQGEDGQWEGGALFPARRGESAGGDPSDRNQGQPWTATEPTLTLLRAFGVDPGCETVRRAVAQVRDHCRWEHAGVRSTSSNESCSGETAPAKSSTRPGCNAHFQPAGTTTCCVPWTTSEKPAIRRTSARTKRCNCSDPNSSPMVRGCWRAPIRATSISYLKTAMVGPAGRTRYGRCVSSAGTSNQAADDQLGRLGHAGAVTLPSRRLATLPRTHGRRGC